MAVDISGIDKVELLHQLWDNMKPASFFKNIPGMVPEFDFESAKSAVSRGYVDYFSGRCIKTDLRGDTAHPNMYDRDAGVGAFAKIVAGLKEPSDKVTDLEDSSSDDSDDSDDDAKLTPQGAVLALLCPDGSLREFGPVGEEMVPGDKGTVLCRNCLMWLNQHVSIHDN